MTKQISILLVDDEEIILESLSRDLSQEGYHVVTATSGEEGCRILEENQFQLVITDLHMGKLHGLQVLKKTKQQHHNTGVIILTGFGDTTSAIEALRLGADDYMLKPCDLEELLLRIEKYLHKIEWHRKLSAEKIKTDALRQNNLELTTLKNNLEEEIHQHHITQQELVDRESLLKNKSQHLEEANSALKHLLKLREGERLQLEEKALADMKDSILYHLRKLYAEDLTETQKSNLQIIETNLHRFVRTFTSGISTKYLKLTPMEIQIIEHIKAGRTTKEIAELLGVSPRTVENHRLKVRQKLGLKHSGANLKSSVTSL